MAEPTRDDVLRVMAEALMRHEADDEAKHRAKHVLSALAARGLDPAEQAAEIGKLRESVVRAQKTAINGCVSEYLFEPPLHDPASLAARRGAVRGVANRLGHL